MALAHDYLDQYGGGERTIAAMARRYPAAPLYTSVYDRDRMRELGFPDLAQPIVVSFMQHLPLRGWLPRHYFSALYPIAFRSFDLAAYDLVLSCSTFAAKAVTLGPRTVHVCYCNTPPRFLWGFDSDTAARAMPPYERPLAQLARLVLRPIDHRAAQRVNLFVANSRNIADRIRAATVAMRCGKPRWIPRACEAPLTRRRFMLIVRGLNGISGRLRQRCGNRRACLVIAETGGGSAACSRRLYGRIRGAVSDADVDR